MDLTQRLNDLLDNDGRPSEADLLNLYDDAEPIDIAFLLGDWAGHAFGTDSPEENSLHQSAGRARTSGPPMTSTHRLPRRRGRAHRQYSRWHRPPRNASSSRFQDRDDGV
jgi:hypothetical protein